ncbi:MAG TPA: glycosyl hydrolase family 18 protein [Acidimicrobiales bacterium]|nr:glycosyl hydrolase family 18 protein [Acidimicrobiales bacterium]
MLSGNAQLAAVTLSRTAPSPVATLSLPASTSPPAPAPPSLADAPPLRSHEVFGFAPYWTLDQSSGFDVNQLSTIAYFSVDVNPDGTLDESGPGWNGYQSQDLSNLVTRAHQVGDRVVLTVTCFDQSALDSLTSSASAPSALASGLISAIEAKNLDGVNLDFEGNGSSDQAGLTKLVTQVSAAIHGVNPHYQVTMDTYASSAGDPNGFYDIPAMAPAIDAFFVMEYQLNLNSPSSANSPLTSSMFSDQTTIDQYTSAVPASKVILGLPYFGIDWPTTDGTLTAQASGPATTLSYAQIVSSGHPVYWDPTTSTAWTSYQVGTQWHETFFEVPTSLYDAAQIASSSDLAGVGIWALGMDGNDPNMLSALLGFSPAVKDTAVGPSTTTQAASTSTTTTSTSSPTSTSSTTTSTSATTPSETVPTSTAPTSTTTTTTTTTTSPLAYQYSGDWNGQIVVLTPWSSSTPPDAEITAGQLTGFSTNDPATSCLMSEPSLSVEPVSGDTNDYLVVATEPGDCTNAVFTFTATATS